jgi:23S rRNA (adenine2030-N6)-methyltransferase
MFSYRHVFHSGNHADVLKHAALLAVIRYMGEKPVPITVLDTHAGAGLYRLDVGQAQTSGEAAHGIFKLWDYAEDPNVTLAPLLADYIALLKAMNGGKNCHHYPGSPLLVHSQLRADDKLKLFEMHPTDGRLLNAEMRRHNIDNQIVVLREDGFTAVQKFFPPPSRRGLLVCDPSYEIKSDYAKVQDMVSLGLTRFPTGTYFIWYPIIARPEAHNLPRRLKTLCNQAGKPWLHVTLNVRGGKSPVAAKSLAAQDRPRGQGPAGGLSGSGVFIVNPPFTLKGQLEPALKQLVEVLGQDQHASSVLETS